MHFLIGDLQGCDDAFARLLAQIGFSPSRDRLTVLGDLVNRGPGSLAVLQRMHALDGAADALLGNHDLHLLAVAHGVRAAHRDDTLQPILDDPRRDVWLDWLAARPLAVQVEGWLCVHAGVLPPWSAAQTLSLAGEVQALLRGPERGVLLRTMYGNAPARWDDALQGPDRWRLIINALTRLRFVHVGGSRDGTMDFEVKEGAGAAPPGLLPWFDAPGRASAGTPIACGHWSTLGLVNRPDLLALDTGCVWGGSLTAARIDGGRREITQVRCAQARRPG